MYGLKAVSLFCGCGGTDLGLLGGFKFLNKKYPRNNIEIVFSNDIEESACKIYDENFENKCTVGDIRNIDSNDIPDHDILTGGFPCQSFSIVALNPPRLGHISENGKLFFEMARILREKKPKVFVAENVKGILSANERKAFPIILNEFEKAGYVVDYKILNAAWFGIPQKRERVFIVGFREDLDLRPTFPERILTEEKFVSLKHVISDHNKVNPKYYFSGTALRGLKKANPKMNKGRIQDMNRPCSTVGAHLAKVSLNSTDPVLKVGGRYRRFTPREVARIQSFPYSFKIVGTDSHQYKSFGNAVPPVMMWHVTREIIKNLSTSAN